MGLRKTCQARQLQKPPVSERERERGRERTGAQRAGDNRPPWRPCACQTRCRILWPSRRLLEATAVDLLLALISREQEESEGIALWDGSDCLERGFQLARLVQRQQPRRPLREAADAPAAHKDVRHAGPPEDPSELRPLGGALPQHQEPLGSQHDLLVIDPQGVQEPHGLGAEGREGVGVDHDRRRPHLLLQGCSRGFAVVAERLQLCQY
mmetsp:Transcript_26691/g.69753  ORF Transcript_26691/g.69753 Transcript_26691/m.69753 type:complete len:210 (-) Transcript_26691:90-719(-)